MVIVKTILKILLILIGTCIGLYAIEVAFFPKKVMEYQLIQKEFEDAAFLDINYKLRANKYAIGKNKESNGWFVSSNR